MSVLSDYAAAAAVALAPTLAVVATSLLQRRKLQEIHVLVNDRLDEALSKIDRLQAALARQRARTADLEIEQSKPRPPEV